MTPFVVIRKKDRVPGWVRIDYRDEEGIEAIVVLPLFGPNHRAGVDCWCHPMSDDGLIVHNECH